MPFLPDMDMEFDPDGSKEQVAVIMKGQTYREAGLRKSTYPNIEGPLYDRLCQLPRHKFRNDVRKMALNIAISANIMDFKPTVDWLDNFMRRFCLSRKKSACSSSQMLKIKGHNNRKILQPPSSIELNAAPSSKSAADDQLDSTSLYSVLGIPDPQLETSIGDVKNDDSGVIQEVTEVAQLDPLGDIPCTFQPNFTEDNIKDISHTPPEMDNNKEEISLGSDQNVKDESLAKKKCERVKITNRLNTETKTQDELNSINGELISKSISESDDDSIEELPKPPAPVSEIINLDDSDSSSNENELKDVQIKQENDVQSKPDEDVQSNSDKDVQSNSDKAEMSRESNSQSEKENNNSSEDCISETEDCKNELSLPEYSKKERRFYEKSHASLQRRFEEKLSQCTACYIQINHHDMSEVFVHPMLGVLICKKCNRFYGKGKFQKDSEGYDEYCRWCANGGDLLLCDFCQNGFCKKCIKRNLGRAAETEAVQAKSWVCYVCDLKPLEELRAMYRIVIENFKNEKEKKNLRWKGKANHSQALKKKFQEYRVQVEKKNKQASLSVSPEKDNGVISTDDCLLNMRKLIVGFAEQVDGIENRKKLKHGVEADIQANRRLLRLINVIEENLSTLKKAIEMSSESMSIQTASIVSQDMGDKTNSETGSVSIMKKTKKRHRERVNSNNSEDGIPSPLSKKNCSEHTESCKDAEEETQIDASSNVDDEDMADLTEDDVSSKETAKDQVEVDGDSEQTLDDSHNHSKKGKVKINMEKSSEKAEESTQSDYCLEEDSVTNGSPSLLSDMTQVNMTDIAEKDSAVHEENLNVKDKDSTKEATHVNFPDKFKAPGKRKRSCSGKKKQNEKPQSTDETSDYELTQEDVDSVVKTPAEAKEPDNLKSETENQKAFESLLVNTDSEDDNIDGNFHTKFSKVSPDKKKKRENINESENNEIEKVKNNKVKENGTEEKSEDKENEVESKPSPLRFKKNHTGHSQEGKTKQEKETERKNFLAKRHLLQSDSDSDEDIDIIKNLEKKKRKAHLRKRTYKPKPKSVQESLEKQQLSNAVVIVTKLDAGLLSRLEKEHYIDVSDYPDLKLNVETHSLFSDSEDELAAILKVKAVKSVSKNELANDDNDEEDEDEDEDVEDDKGSKSKKEKIKKPKSDENKKQGLMDISLDKDDDVDGEEEDEEKEETEKTTSLNDELKKQLLMSSDEDQDGKISDEEVTVKQDKDICDEKVADELEKKRRERYEKNKLKMKNEQKNEESDEGEEKAEKVKKQGIISFKFSSSEDDESEKDSPRKGRMFVDSDSDSDFEVSKKNKKKRKMGVFDSSSDGNYSDGSDNDTSDDNKKDKKSGSRKRIKRPSSSTEEEEEQQDANNTETPSKKRHRRIIRDEDLLQSTKEATLEEQERRERVKERQAKYNKLFEIDVEQDQQNADKLVLDFDDESKKELVTVHPKLVASLKPHQVSGIRFVWEATIENVERLEKGEKGGGCILAHCMGLGKTLQVISFVHTILTNERTNQYINRIMVCCPVNTVYNWMAEFNSWLKGKNMMPFGVVELISGTKNLWSRAYRLDDWYKEGGVCIIGYDMFRNLSKENNKRYKGNMKTIFQKALVSPGPDMMICDEGHIIKNEKTAISISINKIKTRRRVVLTGTPLQNNLKEYHCMIQFVKPNLLGSTKEFMNRFVHPIEAGQCMDALPRDVRRMKRRAHILHNLLEGCVQRFDYTVLKPFLPPKYEYVVSIQMSELQCKLYSYYLENLAQGGPKRTGSGLFVDFNNLSRIWSHPVVLFLALRRREMQGEDEEDSECDERFINDDSESETSSSEDERRSKKKKKQKKNQSEAEPEESAEQAPKEKEEESVPVPVGLTSAGKVRADWWRRVLHELSQGEYDEDDVLNRIEISGKLTVLLDILRECGSIGDKVLVFSQSILALDMIEEFLRMLDAGEITFPVDRDEWKETGDKQLSHHFKHWKPEKDYLRLDGSISADIRKNQCKEFNNTVNERCRLFLISTRAGGVGINLVAANRVVIFDSSWNPSHDTQSIFRVYRFGQKKPCYVYRFVAQGTMEEKIYSRQVTKLSTSLRVVDEHQIKRYFNMAELSELYQFTPATVEERETPSVPDDRLLAELLIRNKKWIVKYHEQDSLLENQTGEELTEEERKAAWEDYENEKKGFAPPKGPMGTLNLGPAGLFPAGVAVFDVKQIIQSISANNPNITAIQLQENLLLAVQQIQKVHLAQYQKIQGFMYNLKNPMIAPEILRQIPSASHPEVIQNLERQLKTLEDNIQSENKVVEQLSRLNRGNVSHNSMVAAGLAWGNPTPGTTTSSAQYVSRNYTPNYKMMMPPKKTAEVGTSGEVDAPSANGSKDKGTSSDSAEVVTLE